MNNLGLRLRFEGLLCLCQQTLLKDFVDRRGGGVLFLGGKDALSDGGWKTSADVDLLPTILPDRKNTFVRMGATAELTAAGIRKVMENADKL